MSSNDSAFPGRRPEAVKERGTIVERLAYFPGLTQRELFAAVAMQGILSNSHEAVSIDPHSVAVLAIEAADALLAELAKKPEGA